MYMFSLSWFKEVFQKSLRLANAARVDDGGASRRSKDGSEQVRSPRPAASMGSLKFSLEERIDLLTQTITEEFFKKVQIAVFDQDRPLIASMLAIRVMQSEGLLDKSLLNFLVNGPQSMSQKRDGGQVQPRRGAANLDSMLWADLQALARIRPFNDVNLLEHISGHPQAWNAFLSRRDAPLSLGDFPNAHLLDFSPMIDPEADTQPPLEELAQERASAKAGTLRPATSATGGKAMGKAPSTKEAIDVGDQETVNSEKGPESQTGTSMKRSESEVLNDADLWNVSETEDEDAAEDGASRSDGEDSKDLDQNGEQNNVETQEQEMARYMIQVSPSVLGTGAGS